MPAIRETADGVQIDIIVAVRSSKTALVGLHDDRIKIRLAAPPVEGKANEELIEFLAKLLRLPKSSVTITSGERGKRKTVLAVGAEKSKVESALNPK